MVVEGITDLGLGLGLTAVGAGIAFAAGAYGTAVAEGVTGSSAIGAVAEKPEMMGKALIFVALCESSVIFGFVIAALFIFMIMAPILEMLV